MSKPVVHYTIGSNTPVHVGQHVWLKPVDHTSYLVSNHAEARTSRVVTVFPDHEKSVEGSPVFETQNTLYVPTTQQQTPEDDDDPHWS